MMRTKSKSKSGRQRPIMVAIGSPGRTALPALRKAAALAKSRGAGVHLVHIVAVPHGSIVVAGAIVRSAAEAEIRSAKAQLLKLAQGPVLRGVPTAVTASWDYPAADGIIRQVMKHRPQLLLAQSHRHGAFARVWLSNTDWELIRQCPCPLWLSKTTGSRSNARVLAAVDPFHAHEKPGVLDDVILRHALEVAGADPRKVLACHTYSLPQPVIIDGAVAGYWMSDKEREAYEEWVRKRVAAVAARRAIPTANILVAAGDPVYQLPRIAKKQGVGVVVMGAVSRSGLKRLFIGHTAERVIDELSCDVLIVKPRGFKSNVPRRIRLMT